MCGRYNLDEPQDIYRRFRIALMEEDLASNYNVSPGQIMPVILRRNEENRMELMKWGLVPSWSLDDKIGYKLINARSETLHEKVSFRKLLKSQRCLIPARGFYEWLRQGTSKKPYYFHLKSNDLYGFAGLYDSWRSPQNQMLKTFTIITTTPNNLVAPVHDRMPVLIKKENEDFWLDPHVDDTSALSTILAPYPPEEMESYAVSSEVNAPKNNYKSLLTPLN